MSCSVNRRSVITASIKMTKNRDTRDARASRAISLNRHNGIVTKIVASNTTKSLLANKSV